jgi:hypothetical protein
VRKSILILAALALWSAPAQAVWSGNDLLQYCSDPNEGTPKRTACLAYISGLGDAMKADKTICREPQEVTLNQLVKMMLKYLNTYPERLHYSAPALFFDMYSDAFPCPQQH